jgi:hypothetical protein
MTGFCIQLVIIAVAGFFGAWFGIFLFNKLGKGDD